MTLSVHPLALVCVAIEEGAFPLTMGGAVANVSPIHGSIAELEDALAVCGDTFSTHEHRSIILEDEEPRHDAGK